MNLMKYLSFLAYNTNIIYSHSTGLLKLQCPLFLQNLIFIVFKPDSLNFYSSFPPQCYSMFHVFFNFYLFQALIFYCQKFISVEKSFFWEIFKVHVSKLYSIMLCTINELLSFILISIYYYLNILNLFFFYVFQTYTLLSSP